MHGATIKMLQNTLHHGLILWKVSIKTVKTVTIKHHPHGLTLSVITFLIEFTVMK